jgi:hypothetical protein
MLQSRAPCPFQLALGLLLLILPACFDSDEVQASGFTDPARGDPELGCVVEDEVVVRCSDDDPLVSPCDEAFVLGCSRLWGQVEPIPDAREAVLACDDGNPLLPPCDRPFERACDVAGGALQCVERPLHGGGCSEGQCRCPGGLC